ncbi:MAG: hypothetical protein ABIZ09_05445, partial [Rhodoferax sp.]
MIDVAKTRHHRNQLPSVIAAVVFNLLNPIAFGFFVAALVFDAVYANSAVVMWFKASAWLIAIGLVFAVIPRFINLARVWFPGSVTNSPHDKLAFFLYFLGIATAIFNAFVHGRDAYAIMPEGLVLSVVTVVLIVASNVVLTLQQPIHQQ